MNCKNCGQIAGGKFCAHCGQSTKVGRINLPSFLSEVSGSVFQINSGFFYTLKELFVRPGHSIKEYLSGKRKNHFKPIAYAFTLSTIYFLLSRMVGSKTFLSDFLEGYSMGATGSEIEAEQLTTLNWFAKNYAYSVLLLLPLYSLASYLLFLRSGFNYLEHFTLNAYVTGQQALVYSLFSILSLITDHSDLLALFTLAISMAYAFFVFWQFFSEHSRGAVLLRTIFTYVLYLIMFFLALFILLVGAVI